MSSKHREQGKDGQGAVPEAASTEQAAATTASQVPPAEPKPDQSAGKAGAAPEDAALRAARLEAELAAVREELSAVNDKYLRKLADDVNFRKRMAREKEDGQRYALSGLLGDLVPVLDDFDRAIGSSEASREYAVLHDGIVLIRRQLGQVLEGKYGLKRFESVGQPFDPQRHEAVAVVQGQPGEGDEAVVAEEFAAGYGLHERVLRTAKVRVRMPAPAAEPKAGGEGA